jgi:hypothetical protein
MPDTLVTTCDERIPPLPNVHARTPRTPLSLACSGARGYLLLVPSGPSRLSLTQKGNL